MPVSPEELFEQYGPAVIAEVQRQTKRFGSLGVVLRALHCEVPRSLSDQYLVLADFLDNTEGGILTFLNEANAVAAPRPKATSGLSGAAIRREAGPMKIDSTSTGVSGSGAPSPGPSGSQTQQRSGTGTGSSGTGARAADASATVPRPSGGTSGAQNPPPGSHAYHELAETQIRPSSPASAQPPLRGSAAASAALNSPQAFATPMPGRPQQGSSTPASATPGQSSGSNTGPYTGQNRRSGMERRVNVADRRQKLEVTFRNRRFGGWDRRKILRRVEDRVKKGIQKG